MISFLRSLQATFVLFSRIPLASSSLEEKHFLHAHYFLPVIGLFIGLGMVLTYQLSNIYLSPNTSALFALFSGILLTGALHEDGFADCCDGFGGGKNREHIIVIMKDSRLGSFGVLGLIGIIGIKVALFHDIAYQYHLIALVTLSVAARITPLLIMTFLSYIESHNSKMTQSLSSNTAFLCISLLSSIFCLQFLHSLHFILYLLALIMLITMACRWYFASKLGGYNGDCLGASEQLSECAVLFLMAIYY